MTSASGIRRHSLARGLPGSIAVIIGTVCACTIIGHLTSRVLDHENVILIYFLGITLIAVRGSLLECIATCTLSVMAFAFFIVPPTFSFIPHDPQFLFTFAAMYAVSILISLVVTSRSRAIAKIEHQAEMIDLTYDAIIEWNVSDCKILFWNTGAERLFSLTAENAVGQCLPKLFPTIYPTDFDTIIAEVKAEGYWSGEIIYQLENKPPLTVASRWTYRPDKDGEVGTVTEFATDITEKKNAELRVREFYSMVSHELRTPLTSIRGSLQLLENDIVQPASDEGQELIVLARTQSELLTELINDILDLQKIESGKFDMNMAQIQIDTAINTVVSHLAVTAKEANIVLATELRTHCSVEADIARISQVLTNLIANAIKFSPSDTTVKISTERRGGRLRVSVQDKGPGIARDQMPKLFGKFQQLDSSDTRVHGGTGLGLAISKAIVEQHNGVIGVDSEEGVGSTFWFELDASSPYTGSYPAVI